MKRILQDLRDPATRPVAVFVLALLAFAVALLVVSVVAPLPAAEPALPPYERLKASGMERRYDARTGIACYSAYNAVSCVLVPGYAR